MIPKILATSILVITILLASALPLVAKTAEDQLGRKVQIPDDPQRVVALAPSITEIIFALGQQDRLKGTTQFSNYPAEAAKLPKVGSYVRLDLERIVALHPDLCIAIKDGNPKDTIERLQSLNIPVFAVNPRNLETVMQTIQKVGDILNASERAKTLVQAMRGRIQRVDALVASIDQRPRVFIQIGISPIISAGTNTFIHELIVRAGGINVAAGKKAYPHFSREQVLALAPDVLIITSMSRSGAFEKAKSDWRRLIDTPAGLGKRIYTVDSDVFDRPSPRLLDALEILTRLLHPELFKDGS
ncbi:MAG: cobalamin-binding protein [Desulfobacterales bacterium]|jgi:iron complex transport system substrate-binding protein